MNSQLKRKNESIELDDSKLIKKAKLETNVIKDDFFTSRNCANCFYYYIEKEGRCSICKTSKNNRDIIIARNIFIKFCEKNNKFISKN
jgi:hypothetical protein